jgi:hypothetical protein
VRLWTETFDTQSAAGWDVTNGTVTFDTTTPRQGAASLSCTTATAVAASISKAIYPADDPAAHVFLRAYVRVNTAPSTRTAILAWADSSSDPTGFACIRLNTDRTMICGGSSVTTGTASAALALGQWYRIEMQYDDTVNVVKAYLNGVLWATATVDLTGGRYARVGVIQAAIADIDVDDVVVDDATLGRTRERDTAGLLAARVATPTAELVDDFGDGIVDPALWPDSYGGITEAGGRAQVPCGLDYAAYASAKIYTLRNSLVSCRMYPAPVGDSLVACWTQLLIQTTTPGTDLVAEHNAITNTLGMALRGGYFDPEYLAIPYDPVAHAYLRIRQTGTDLRWETSPDGATWTTRRTSPAPAWVSDPNLQVQLIAHRDDGTPALAEFDDVNVAPTMVTVPLGTAGEATAGRAVAGAKARALSLASADESARSWTGEKSAGLGTAGTQAAGQRLTAARTARLNTAGDRSAVGTLTSSSAAQLGHAGDTATAQSLVPAKTTTPGPARAADSARPLVARKRLLLGTAAAVDLADSYVTAGETRLADARAMDRGHPVTGSKTTTLRLAAAGDDALPVTAAKTHPLDTATTEERAQRLTVARALPLGAAREQAGAGTLTLGKHLTLGTAANTSRARMLHLRSSGDIGSAWDTEDATPLTASKQLVLGVATTAETSAPLDAGHTVPLGVTSTADRAVEVAAGKVLRLGVARCTEQAAAAAAGKHQLLRRAVATDGAGRIRQPFQTRRLRAAQEADRASPVPWLKQRPADDLTSSVTGPVLAPSTGGPRLIASVAGPSLTPSTTGGG